MKQRPGNAAHADHAKAKALERWRRHNERALAAGRRRIVLSLPSGVIDQLDQIRGDLSRSDAALEALQDLIRREQAPVRPAPPPPAPKTATDTPRGTPAGTPQAIAMEVARKDRANRFPVLVILPAVVPGSDLEGTLLTTGLRRRRAGWTGRVRGGTARRLAELVAVHGGTVHITGARGDLLLRPEPGAAPELPPPVRSPWIDALRAYWARFGQPPPGGVIRPPRRPRPGHLSPPRHEHFLALPRQRLVPVLREAAESGEILTKDAVRQAMFGGY